MREGLWAPPNRALTAGLVLAITFVAAEALAVVTIMPVVARDLGGLWLYGWVFSAFMLGSIVGIVAAGREADRHGPALPFLAGLVLFSAGLAVAGLAPSMLILVAGRALQGIGGGAVPAVAYASIGRGLPGRLRARMMAVLSTAWVVPGLAGPALSAEVAHLFGWRWVFLGLLPLVAIAGLIAVPSLRRLGPPGTRHAGGHRLTDGVRVAAGHRTDPGRPDRGRGGLRAGRAPRWSGQRADRGRADPGGRGDRAARAAAAGPARDRAGPARAAGHRAHPGPAHVRVLRRRRLRDADHHRAPAPQPGAGRRRGDRLDAGLDHRRLDPGPAQRQLAGPPPGAHRAGHHPGRYRRDDHRAGPGRAGARRAGRLVAGRAGHGGGLRADHADDAA